MRLRGSLIAPRALPNMRGALRSEAKHPVSCHRITIRWYPETSVTLSEKESQSPATRTRSHPHTVRWGRPVKRQDAKARMDTKNARDTPLNLAPGIFRASESVGSRKL
jgi:hypothetical protein